VVNYLRAKNLDIFFLQEAGIVDWSLSLPVEYSSVKNVDSVIVYKRSIFDHLPHMEFHQEFHTKYASRINFNKDSVYAIFGNFLLIAVHLSSKAHRIEQAKEMFLVLKAIGEEYPQLKIILGVDANQPLNRVENITIFPVGKEFITTSKKRTMLQVQFHKSDVLDQ